MLVRVHILYEPPVKGVPKPLLTMARSLTKAPEKVVAFEGQPGWVIVEFTMPNQAQYKVIDDIDRAIRHYADDRSDSIIEFPKTEEERERSRKKAARRRERRRSQGRG